MRMTLICSTTRENQENEPRNHDEKKDNTRKTQKMPVYSKKNDQRYGKSPSETMICPFLAIKRFLLRSAPKHDLEHLLTPENAPETK